MITLEITLVRLIGTGEPVAVFDRVKSINELARKVDEVATPSDCEYVDAVIKTDFSLLFASPMGKIWQDSGEDFLEGASIGYGMLSEIEDLFLDEFLEWSEIPKEIDSICLRRDAETVMLSGDIF